MLRNTKLGGGSNKNQFRIADECREVCHSSNTQKDEWRIPSLFYSLIENIEYGVVLVKTDFESCVSTEWDVAKDNAQSDRYEKQRFEILLDGEPDEDGSH